MVVLLANFQTPYQKTKIILSRGSIFLLKRIHNSSKKINKLANTNKIQVKCFYKYSNYNTYYIYIEILSSINSAWWKKFTDINRSPLNLDPH